METSMRKKVIICTTFTSQDLEKQIALFIPTPETEKGGGGEKSVMPFAWESMFDACFLLVRVQQFSKKVWFNERAVVRPPIQDESMHKFFHVFKKKPVTIKCVGRETDACIGENVTHLLHNSFLLEEYSASVLVYRSWETLG